MKESTNHYTHYRDVYQRSLRVLLKVYPIAKQNILFYETHEKVKAISALTDLRDVLDHLAVATMIAEREGDSPEAELKIRDQLTSAEEHLRRAAIEPLELAVEDRMYRVIHKVKWGAFGPLALLPRVAPADIAHSIGKATAFLEEGRRLKGSTKSLKQSCEAFRAAYAVLEKADEGLPEVPVVKRRLVLAATIMLAAVTGAMLTWVVLAAA